MSRRAVWFCLPFVLLAGCPALHSSPPTVVKISINQPGFAPEDMEMEICVRTRMAILSVSHVKAITFVSLEGHADIYVKSEPNINDAEFLTKIESVIKQTMPDLPADAKLVGITKCAQKDIPTKAIIKDVDRLNLRLDREKVARLGVSIQSITDAVKKASDSSEPLEEVTIEASNGDKIRLDEVAEIKTVCEPNCRIMHWPPKESEE